jgi:pimeloyl-ACP methyl ester carboxylesterase
MVMREGRSRAPRERADETAAGLDGGERGLLRSGGAGMRRLRGGAALVLGRSWLDPPAFWVLRRWFFPLSRLWAAAGVSRGSAEAFFAAVPCDTPPNRRERVLALLARFEERRVVAAAVDAAWHRSFFPPRPAESDAPTVAECIALERARHRAAHDHYAMRRKFSFLISTGVPPVGLRLPDPGEVEAAYGAALADAAPFFAPPEPMPAIEVSRCVPTEDGRDFWLRFMSPSPRLADLVYARVYEPAGVKDPPTVIFGHGICVEFDQWDGLIDEAAELCRLGLRVIRPEAPWHGRRAPAGCYGGERMIATFPAGSLDLFTGAVREWAVLADWARRTSAGPLAFGGASLGALTAQLAASRARDWPASLRPDALFLITHCEQFSQAAIDGELPRIWGGRAIWETKGWCADQVERYLRLLDPGSALGIRPERIVTVLGRRDKVTPFASGAGLIDKWRVPEANRFIWDRGHFSIPLTLMHDRAPFRRFRDVLG